MTTTDIAEIQRQMAQIRNEMHQEIQGAVRSAQSLTDWQGIVKSHPWLSLSTAALAGYLLVPRSHAQAPTIVTLPGPTHPLVAAAGAPAPQPRKSPWRFVGLAFSLVAPVAVRAAQNYVLGHVEEWLAQHPLPAPGQSGAGPAREPGRTVRQGTAPRLREFG
jgi:hypothetical protein